MAEKYIINMPLKTTPDDTDLMIIEDAQDTKRMTWANVVKPIEDLVDNTVAAHEAESASKHIHSSGSNANGSYIRFDDGTMICQQSVAQSVAITNTMGALYRSDAIEWVYPAVFISAATVTISATQASTVHLALSGLISANLSTNMTFSISSTMSTTAAIRCNLLAFGRWK